MLLRKGFRTGGIRGALLWRQRVRRVLGVWCGAQTVCASCGPS